MTAQPPAPSTRHSRGTSEVAQMIMPRSRTVDTDMGNQNLYGTRVSIDWE